MGEAFSSYAAEVKLDEQNSETNIANVNFDVYLDENDTNTKQISKDINTSDLNLFVYVSVKNEGKLENAKIDFSNSNFELKENSKVFEKNIKTISSGNGITVKLPIVARQNSSYDLSLLNMISKINLSGDYIDNNGNVEEINATKMVNIEWTTNEVTEEQVELSQEVITNKIYNMDNVNKRIVQVLVKSNIEKNMAPVKSTKLEIKIPQIGSKPEQVKVVAKNTLATNGKTSIEFANLQTSKYEYNEEQEKIYIEVLNNNDNSNKISWQKNVADEFIVTYVYSDNAKVSPFVSEVKAIIDIYGSVNKSIEKENTLKLEEVESTGEIATLANTVSSKIYKGDMYLGDDTIYKTKWNTFVSYKELAKKLTIQDTKDTMDSENLSTYYKTTKINKSKALDVLGKTGTIKIYSAQDAKNLIKEIVLAEEIEGEYITVTYPENTTKIIVETTEVVKEGYLEIINEKAIKVVKAEELELATKLDTEVELIIVDSQNQVSAKLNKTANSNLLEPTTTIDTELDKSSISSQVENTLKITTVLKTTDNSNKLFENPIVKIELPKEITEASLENISLLYEEELKIKSSEIITNENGNKVLVIELEGKQTGYTTSIQGGANIVIDLKVKTNSFMANKKVSINTICINKEETVNILKDIKIVSKAGLITKNSLTIGENKIEKINQKEISTNITKNSNANINTAIMNNFGEKVSNISIEGKIPSGISLEGAILSNTEGVIIQYSEDLTSWVEEVSDYSKVKAFKIALKEMENASVIELAYNVVANVDNIEKNTALTNDLNISYEINNQKMKDNISFTLNAIKEEPKDESKEDLENEEPANAENLEINIVSTIGGEKVKDGAEINNGQVLRYKVRIKNISSEDLNNVNLKATIQNGVFYDLVEFARILDETPDENGDLLYPEGRMTYIYDEAKDLKYKEFSIKKLKAGETKEFEYQVVAYIGEGENANKFSNNLLIKADGMQDVKVSDKKLLKDASIALKLRYAFNEEVEVYSEDIAKFFIEVNNLANKELQNVNVKLEMPEQLDCDITNQLFIDTENVVLTKNGKQLNVLFKTIGANEKLSETIEFKTNSIPLNELEKDIILKLVGTIEGEENIYISNDYIKTILQSKSHVETEITSDKLGQKLKNGDEITYTATIKNDGYKDLYTVVISDVLQKELKFVSGKVIYSNGQEVELREETENYISDYVDIAKQDSIKIVIKVKVDLTDSTAKTISNKITILSNSLEQTDTETLINEVQYDIHQKPEDDNPPEDEIKTNSISGLAWIDSNKDGIRNNREDIVQAIKVILINKEGKQIAETTTSLTGTYKFTDVEQGEYILVFAYDTNKYQVTKYQVAEATEDTNSDAISKEIKVNETMTIAGVTDIIKITGKDISNIDIGLIKNDKFDLSLNKYISKVIVSNSKGTTTYEYNQAQLAKVEISAKHMAGTTLLVEYEMEVANEGDIDGFVTDIIDYLPKELEFNSEMNTGWYIGTDKYLHYMPLETKAIEPGKTQTVRLILTKTLKSDSAGVIDNIAEIAESSNLQGIIESDSVAGNKVVKEDDISTASLIVSIATGSPIIYIGITIASMMVLGLGIYLINKKVLKDNI